MIKLLKDRKKDNKIDFVFYDYIGSAIENKPDDLSWCKKFIEDLRNYVNELEKI